MSKRVDMSDAQLKKLADHGGDFLRERIVTPDLICKFVEWDLASPEDLRAVADVIMDWRPDAQLVIGLSQEADNRREHGRPLLHNIPVGAPLARLHMCNLLSLSPCSR